VVAERLRGVIVAPKNSPGATEAFGTPETTTKEDPKTMKKIITAAIGGIEGRRRSGLSTSVGGGPLRFSRGADGKLRRTIRVPGVGLYDTKVIGQHSKLRAGEASQDTTYSTREDADVEMPPRGWDADAAGAHASRYWDGQQWTEATAQHPRRQRRVWPWVIGGLIAIWMIGTASSCIDRQTDNSSPSGVTSTVTKTVTVTAQPTTVTDEPTATVTVTQVAPPLTVLEPPAPSATNYPPPPSSNVYYKNCSEARKAGVTPLYEGDPGYAPHLDRDRDGIACE